MRNRTEPNGRPAPRTKADAFRALAAITATLLWFASACGTSAPSGDGDETDIADAVVAETGITPIQDASPTDASVDTTGDTPDADAHDGMEDGGDATTSDANRDAALDTASDADADSESCAESGCPCASHDGCVSGACVAIGDGGICLDRCGAEAPCADGLCRLISEADGDAFYCVPEAYICEFPVEERCNGRDDDCNGEIDDGLLENACGGCTELAAEPRADCGPCNVGQYVCNGTDSVACEFDPDDVEYNACGGCSSLRSEIGARCVSERCGFTGEWACNGEEATACACPDRTCGDGAIDPGEECDDGNREDGDGCNEHCLSELPPMPCEGPESLEIDAAPLIFNSCSAPDAQTFEPIGTCEGSLPANRDRTFTVEIPERGVYRFNARDADPTAAIDVVLHVREECLATETQVSCADDIACDESTVERGACIGDIQPREARLILALEAGTYFVVVEERTGERSGREFECGAIDVSVVRE